MTLMTIDSCNKKLNKHAISLMSNKILLNSRDRIEQRIVVSDMLDLLGINYCAIIHKTI
jgi:hypothetical protein